MKIITQEEILAVDEWWGPGKPMAEFKIKRGRLICETYSESEILEKPKILKGIVKDIKNIKRRISFALKNPVVKVQLTRDMFFNISGFLRNTTSTLSQISQEEIECNGETINIPKIEKDIDKVERLLGKIQYVVDNELVTLDTGMNRRDKYFKLIYIYPNRTNLYDSGFATKNTVIFHDDGISINEFSVLVNCQIHGTFNHSTEIENSYLENCTVGKGCSISDSIIKFENEVDVDDENLIAYSKIEDSVVLVAGLMFDFHIKRTSIRHSMIKLRKSEGTDIFTLDDMIILVSRIVNVDILRGISSKFQGVNSRIESGVINNISLCLMNRSSIVRSIFSDCCMGISSSSINMEDVSVNFSRLINPVKDKDVVFNLIGFNGAKQSFSNMTLIGGDDLHIMRMRDSIFALFPYAFYEKERKFKEDEINLIYRLDISDYVPFLQGDHYMDFVPRIVSKLDIDNVFNRRKMNPVDQKTMEQLPLSVINWISEVKQRNGCNEPLKVNSPYLVAKSVGIPQFNAFSSDSIKELMLGDKITDMFYVSEVE